MSCTKKEIPHQKKKYPSKTIFGRVPIIYDICSFWRFWFLAILYADQYSITQRFSDFFGFLLHDTSITSIPYIYYVYRDFLYYLYTNTLYFSFFFFTPAGGGPARMLCLFYFVLFLYCTT